MGPGSGWGFGGLSWAHPPFPPVSLQHVHRFGQGAVRNVQVAVGGGDAAVAHQPGDGLQGDALALQGGDVGMAAAVGRQPAHIRDWVHQGPEALAEVLDGAGLPRLVGGDAEQLARSLAQPEGISPEAGRDRDGADAPSALGRAQHRGAVHHLHRFVDAEIGAVLGDVLGGEGHQLLHPEAGAQHQADTVALRRVGKAGQQGLHFRRGEGVLGLGKQVAGHRFHPDGLGGTGGVAVQQAVGHGAVQDLDQHGPALADFGVGVPLPQQPGQVVVDGHGLDIGERRLSEMLLQRLERVFVVGVGGHLHLGAVVLIPPVRPRPEQNRVRFRRVQLLLLVVPHLLQKLPLGGRGERADNPLAGDGVVAVHQLAAPLAARVLGDVALPMCAFSCHGATSHGSHVGAEVWRDVGLHVHPGQEWLLGDAHPAADAEDGEILAVGQLIDRGLADAQIVADFPDGEVGLLIHLFHGSVFLSVLN